MTIRFNEPLEPIDLSVFDALFFFEGENDDDADEGETDVEGDGNEGEGSGETDGGEADDEAKPKKKSDREARYRLQLRQTEKELEEYRSKLKEFEDRDKTDLEKIQSERDDLAKSNQEVLETVRALRVRNAAIMSASKFNFRDIDDALKFAMDGIDEDLSEDDIPDVVEESLKDLAKKKPYLLKDSSEEDDKEESREPSGRNTNRSKASKGKLDEEALLQKFPALRR